MNLAETLREVHMRGFVHGEDMPAHAGLLEELVALGYVKERDPVLAAALVTLACADQPERAAEAASSLLKAAEEPSPFGHSALYDVTKAGFRCLEAAFPPVGKHCGRIRNWTTHCYGPKRCACPCSGCSPKFAREVRAILRGHR